MKKILFIACLSLISIYIQAQTLYTSATATIYISGAANIDGSLSSSPTLYVQGAIQNTGTLTNAGEMQTRGNFDNPGTFASTGDNGFIGAATQNLSGAFMGSEAFYNLIVDKTVNPVVLSVNADVANQVNLVNGKISIGSSSLTLAPTATITGYDANDYILTSSAGTLRQTVGASNVVFPVGISSYNPLTMSNAGTSDVFSVKVQDQVNCQGGNTLATTAKVNRNWNITESVLGGSNAAISVQWNTTNEDATFDRTQSSIATYDANIPTYNLAATNSNAAMVSAGVFSQTKTGQTLIGNVAVTSIAPISAGGATTFCDGGNVVLTSPSDALFTYQWTNNGTNIAGANLSTYTADASGNYTPTITVNGTCTLTPASISVTEQPIPASPTIAFTSPVSANNSITACTGTMVTMTCNTANVYEYLWYRNGVAINYVLTPNNSYTVSTATAGTDVYQLLVTYPTTGQCLSALSAPLTIVKASPPATISPASPVVFCSNTPTTLSANTGANYTYVWKRGASTVQTGGSTFIPTLGGNHSVTVTDGNTSCSKTSAWTTVTINPAPTANAGADKIQCQGNSVQLGIAGIGTNTYTWSPTTGLSNPFIANPTASPTSNTTYTLTVVTPATNCTNTDNVLVTSIVNPLAPTLSSTTTPVCQGSNIVITQASTGANTINWYKNGVILYNKPTSFVQTVSAFTAAPDAYTVKAKDINGCISIASNVINAWVQEAAIPTLTSIPTSVGANIIVCVLGGTSGNATLTANSTTASPAYSWKVGGAYVSGANAANYIQTVTTTANNKVVSVEATYPNGCIKNSNSRTVKLVTSGCTPKMGSDKDNEGLSVINNALSIKAYPNPTAETLHIDIINSESGEGSITLYNTLGQVVLKKEITLLNGDTHEQLNMIHLTNGIYTLSFDTKEIHYIDKVIKE